MVNYFDLGANIGYTIDEAIRQSHGRHPVTVYAVEANPALFESLQEKYSEYPNVHLFNFAVTREVGTLMFYEDSHDHKLGSSIYRDKPNVQGGLEVAGRPFSDFFSELDIQEGKNVIKANIEGAEWDLIQDMVAHDLLGKFDLYLGSSVAGYWSKDMKKIPSLNQYVSEINRIMDEAGIQVKPFYGGPKDINIFDELGL